MKKKFKNRRSNVAKAIEVLRADASAGYWVARRIVSGLPQCPKEISEELLEDLGYALGETEIACTEHASLCRVVDADTGREAAMSFLTHPKTGSGVVVAVRQSELWEALEEEGESN